MTLPSTLIHLALARRHVKKAAASPGVTDAGAETLRRRGVLSPEDIHKLAHKGQKAACHSDNVADAEGAKVVQINTLKATA